MTTRVGRYRVPVRGIHPTIAYFVGGARGAHERGVFLFWTAVLKRPHRGERTCTARARILLPPGERFERMGREARTARHAGARRVYAAWWEQHLRRGAGIAYIRPATRLEVRHWAATHVRDMAHCLSVEIGPPRRTLITATGNVAEAPPAAPALPSTRWFRLLRWFGLR